MATRTDGTADLCAGVNFCSPISRVLALGYYDGPTSGVLQCGEEGPVYKFDLLAGPFSMPNDQADLNIFGLAPLPLTALAELVQAYQHYWPPRWPMWVPTWQFPTAADEKAINRLTDQVLGQAGPVKFVLATSNLLDKIRAAKPVTPEDAGRLTDWPAFLGLPRESPVQES